MYILDAISSLNIWLKVSTFASLSVSSSIVTFPPSAGVLAVSDWRFLISIMTWLPSSSDIWELFSSTNVYVPFGNLETPTYLPRYFFGVHDLLPFIAASTASSILSYWGWSIFKLVIISASSFFLKPVFLLYTERISSIQKICSPSTSATELWSKSLNGCGLLSS